MSKVRFIVLYLMMTASYLTFPAVYLIGVEMGYWNVSRVMVVVLFSLLFWVGIYIETIISKDKI
jgi:hypothetical protein